MNINELYKNLDYVEVQYKMYEESQLVKSAVSQVRDVDIDIFGLIECGNKSYNHCFDISLEMRQAIAMRKELEGEIGCPGKLDNKYKRSTGQSCDFRIEYTITPYFKEVL
mgnify:CR=1 FL=1|jgi:hypothetical protein